MNIFVVPSTELTPVVRDGHDKFIVVFLSQTPTEELQNFRCLNCGWIVAQYSSKEVSAVVYGTAVPKDKTVLDVQCQRCHTMFRIV